MKIYIDTNTFPATPGIYADAEKTKPLPRIVPAVELERGGFEVAFLGENIPAPTDALAIAASIEGTRTQVIAEYGVPVEDAPQATWLFQFALNSEELVKAVEARGSTHLRVGIIATAGEQKRTEWQFLAAVYATASGEIDGKQVESAKDWSDAAKQFAQAAEDSAKFADEKAQEANTLALNASGFADAAEKSATAANNSATAASQSAQNAANSATAAGNAATDAETSRQAAETAKNAAEKAKMDAETALKSVRQEAEDVEAAGAQAVENIGEAKADALGAIDEARGNVYTKAETYSKSQIDGVATGAELTAAMNQAHEWLASVSGKLPPSLYESLLEMLRLWSLNPTSLDFSPYIAEIDRALRDWQDDPSPTAWSYGNGSSPYEGVNIDTALVDFKVKSIRGHNDNTSRPIGTGSTGVLVFPNVEDLSIAFRGFKGLKLPAYAPKGKILVQTYRITSFSAPIFASEAKIIQYLVQGNTNFNDDVFAENANDAKYAFSGCKKLNRSFYFPALSAGNGAFENTAMSAENISATLDSLPTWSDGASHVITFTGSPGAAELTQESPSVAAAVARGWTVEL